MSRNGLRSGLGTWAWGVGHLGLGRMKSVIGEPEWRLTLEPFVLIVHVPACFVQLMSWASASA